MSSSSSPPGARRGIGKASLFGVLTAVLCLAALTVSVTGASAVTSKWTTKSMQMPFSLSTQPESVSCFGANECVAVGVLVNGSTGGPLAERWNGSEWIWETVPAPTGAYSSFLTDVSCSGTSLCTAVGTWFTSAGEEHPFAVRKNGSTWSLMSMAELGGVGSNLKTITCIGSNWCKALGTYTSGGKKVLWAASYNTGTWSAQNLSGIGTTETPAEISCTTGGNCIAAGSYLSASNPVPWALKWDGTNWTSTKVPYPSEASGGAKFEGVSCSFSSCEAVGYFKSKATGQLVPFAEVWNGTEWTVQSAPNPAGSTSSTLTDVSCLSRCWAVGNYTPASGKAPLAEVFESSAWAVDLPNPLGGTEQTLSGASCYSSKACMTVGYYVSGGKKVPMSQTVVRE